MRWTIAIASDLAVIGYNLESADLDRPHGEIIGEVYFLQATNERGDRKVFGGFELSTEAESAIPEAPDVFTWPDGRPEYGSLAYQDYGEADQIESERRFIEAEQYGFETAFAIF